MLREIEKCQECEVDDSGNGGDVEDLNSRDHDYEADAKRARLQWN